MLPVSVPVVVGNHGRRSRKPRSKFRARDNFDWFTGHLLARTFAKDSRVTFDVAESADTFVQSYDYRVCLTHGDQASGGAGIGGIWPPLMRLDARKRQRNAAVNQPYDLLVMGHWHQLVFGPSFIVNGSLKGYDEYAYTSNFGYEDPQQALWLMTPERGKTWTAPITPANRKREGW
jgi:predicted phosphodiesterase